MKKIKVTGIPYSGIKKGDTVTLYETKAELEEYFAQIGRLECDGELNTCRFLLELNSVVGFVELQPTTLNERLLQVYSYDSYETIK